MRDQPRIATQTGNDMAYTRKQYEAGTAKRPNVTVGFSDTDDILQYTSLPVAVSSWVLESIDFTEMINTSFKWDQRQCKVTPGDAIKAMVLTMSMNAERPAIENVASRYQNEPLQVYFGSVEKTSDLNPDLLARALTRFHEAGEDKLFSSVSAAIRSYFGIKSHVIHSDTSSVSVYGEYECYTEDGQAKVINSKGEIELDGRAVYITRGFSKDNHPELKQYMLGDAVDENGIPILSKVLDGNTADGTWNKECLDILKDTLLRERIIYVADSKLVSNPLVSYMLEDGVMFISRCPANFNDSMLEKTLMSFDLDALVPMENISPRKNAATRRVCSKVLEYEGKPLRVVLVETSTLAGNGEKAVAKAEESFVGSLNALEKEYMCKADAEKAFVKFAKKHSRSIFDLSAEYEHDVVEKRPKGRPRKDGTDVRRHDVYTLNIEYTMNEERREMLRRKKGYILLLSNVKTPKEDPDVGLSDEDVVRYYANEWKVEWNFKGKKRPILVERLFLKDPGRAEALITIVNIAALIRAVVQLLLRRGVDTIDPDELAEICSREKRITRKMTYDLFMESCRNTLIRYDPVLNQCRFFNTAGDLKASAFLSLMGISKNKLFTGGI